MSERQKGFFNGTVFMSILSAFIIAITSWMAVRASEVPVLADNLTRLNKTLDRVEVFMHDHNEERTEWKVWKSTIDIKMQKHQNELHQDKLGLEYIDIKCETNEARIDEILRNLGKNKG